MRYVWLSPLKLSICWLLVVLLGAWISGDSDARTWREYGERAAFVFGCMYLVLVAVHALLAWNGVVGNQPVSDPTDSN